MCLDICINLACSVSDGEIIVPRQQVMSCRQDSACYSGRKDTIGIKALTSHIYSVGVVFLLYELTCVS